MQSMVSIEERKLKLGEYIEVLKKKLEKTVIEYNFDFTNPFVVNVSQELDKEIATYQEIMRIQLQSRK